MAAAFAHIWRVPTAKPARYGGSAASHGSSTVRWGATPTPGPAALNWFDRLTGVRIVAAAPDQHNVPSDWWEVDRATSKLTRLTKQYDTSMFGSFSPDGKQIG